MISSNELNVGSTKFVPCPTKNSPGSNADALVAAP